MSKKSSTLSSAAAQLGKAGGAKGGNARARNLTHAQRVKIAKMGRAAQNRSTGK